MTLLDELSAQIGIQSEYRDAHGNRRAVPDQVRRDLAAAFGLSAANDEEIRKSLRYLDRQKALPLPPIIVLRGEPLSVPLRAPLETEDINWTLERENGERLEGSLIFKGLELVPSETASEGRECRRLALPISLEPGYHELHVEAKGWKANARVISVPQCCFLLEKLAGGERVWGISVQLYLLRSSENWGIGDFSDLRRFVELAADMGADVVGLNPLHALFLDSPDDASPYSPASRLFLNILYIDVTSVPGYNTDKGVLSVVTSSQFQADLAACRAAKLVDYPRVTRLKLLALKALHEAFQRRSDPADCREFAKFRAQHGESLELFCRFQALRDYFGAQDPAKRHWQQWPPEFQDCRSPAVTDFAAANAARIDFLAWTQWIADAQLADAAAVAKRRDMAIGLYRDLAVGADGGGAETWSDPETVVQSLHVGAPPDILNLAGQDWGLPPFHPRSLGQNGYQAFIDLVRANMRHAGGLRIDHVMALQRLFLIPANKPPSAGAYVSYPLDDLLGILALESHRHGCLVVGEDLGTVPEGFRERMEQAGILSYRVVFFETCDGELVPPERYPVLALSTVGSHDLATLRGWWQEHDIDLKTKLGLYPEGSEQSQRVQRAQERKTLLRALERRGYSTPTDPDSRSVMPLDLSAALHRFLAQTGAGLAMVQLDDLADELEQVNLPGTSVERQNWRRKVKLPVEDLGSNARAQIIAEIMNTARRRPRP